MARHSLIGGLCTTIVAAGAALGIAYLFKDEIQSTQKYKDLNSKYDIDSKVEEYSKKAKDTAYDLKDKAKDTAKDLKDKAETWKKAESDDIFEDDEIIIGGDDRDYVSIKDAAEDAKDAVADKVDDVKDAVADKVDDIKDAAADKADDIKDAAAAAEEKIEDTVNNIVMD